MEAESALQVFAEVSVALAGFTGVVAVFHDRGGRQWRSLDLLRFRIMLGTSIATLLLSLLPFGLHQLGFAPRVIWGVCSGAFALYLGSVSVLDLRQGRRTGAFKEPGFNPWIPRVLAVLVSSAVLLQILNLLGLGFRHESGPFLLGLLLLIVVCASMFVLLLSFVGRTRA